MTQFKDLVEVRKVGNCASCATYIYTLPCKITKKIEHYLLPFGKPNYNLDKCSVFLIQNEIIDITECRIGMLKMRVKFKTDKEQYKRLFEIHLASFIEQEQGIQIEMEEE